MTTSAVITLRDAQHCIAWQLQERLGSVQHERHFIGRACHAVHAHRVYCKLTLQVMEYEVPTCGNHGICIAAQRHNGIIISGLVEGKARSDRPALMSVNPFLRRDQQGHIK